MSRGRPHGDYEPRASDPRSDYRSGADGYDGYGYGPPGGYGAGGYGGYDDVGDSTDPGRYGPGGPGGDTRAYSRPAGHGGPIVDEFDAARRGQPLTGNWQRSIRAQQEEADAWAAGQNFPAARGGNDSGGGQRMPGYGHWDAPAPGPAPVLGPAPGPGPVRRPPPSAGTGQYVTHGQSAPAPPAAQASYSAPPDYNGFEQGPDGSRSQHGSGRKGKDRRSADRGASRGGQPPVGGGGPDEDYDWIKYLGEGRAAAPNAPALARPTARPRSDRPDSGPAPVQPDSRSAMPPGFPAAPPAAPPHPAPPAREARRRDRGAEIVARSMPAAPAAPPVRAPGEYAQPLYEPGAVGRAAAALPAPTLAEPWLDSQEYKRPLYPPPGEDPDQAPPGRPRRPGREARRGRPDETGPGMAVSDSTSPGLRQRPGGIGLAGEQTVRDRPLPPARLKPARQPAPVSAGPSAAGPAVAGPAVAGPAVAGPAVVPPASPPRKAAVDVSRVGSGIAKRARTATAGVSKTRRPGKAQTVARRPAGKVGKAFGRVPRAIVVVCACLLAAVAGAVGYLVFAPKAAHVVTVPARVGSFVKSPTVDRSTAQALRSKIVGGAAGEVKKVVAAVYEQTTGPGTSQGPQIVVFIGGNLTGGGSAGDFISGFMTQLRGSFTTSPGRLGGQAACAPGRNGGPAECAWADGDTFGVIVSATLDAPGLANQMRMMRPLVELPVK